jgi:quinolinate synthase
MIYQQALPDPYSRLSISELEQRVHAARQELGSRVVILAHHYQRPEIVRLGDFRGDSLKLAQLAAEKSTAEFIVYCGVHFMAESADILKAGDQRVILPDLGAGCDMADMAPIEDVEEAWADLQELISPDDVIPITYINSTAALKAFVGARGGVVCTSSNAARIVRWALEQNKKVFFLPDQHLGRNTCRSLGVALGEMSLWDPQEQRGGLSAAEVIQSRIYLWKGHCPVHMMFSPEQVRKLRERDPAIRIIAHPECAMDVVELADSVGSTEHIVRTIAESPAGSHWAVGTEMNLVKRIAEENPDKSIVSINPFMCLCGTMNRIDMAHLAWSLDNIVACRPENVIEVCGETRQLARLALDRMLGMSN